MQNSTKALIGIISVAAIGFGFPTLANVYENHCKVKMKELEVKPIKEKESEKDNELPDELPSD